MRVIGPALIVSSLAVVPAFDRTAAALPDLQAAIAPRPVLQNYTFPSGAGMLFFYVKPDRTADFEAVVTRLGETLDRAEDPIRRQQAAGWRILRCHPFSAGGLDPIPGPGRWRSPPPCNRDGDS